MIKKKNTSLQER